MVKVSSIYGNSLHQKNKILLKICIVSSFLFFVSERFQKVLGIFNFDFLVAPTIREDADDQKVEYFHYPKCR